MNSCLNLAGCRFKLTGNDDFFYDFTELYDGENLPEIVIHGERKSDNFGVEIYGNKADFTLKDSIYGDIVFADSRWSKIDFYPSGNIHSKRAALLSAVYSRMCFENILLCHSSFVDYHGHGILFTGPSGIGKTTQAKLWNSYRGAEIINGDKIFIKTDGNGCYGYGLPWKGSSEFCLNSNAEIDAVVVLKQAKKNSIKKLDSVEIMSGFVPHIFLPHWDKKCMDSALKTLDKMLSQVNVYQLECLPDETAVELTESVVLG